MSFFSKRNKISPSNTAPADGLTSHSTQRLPPQQLQSPPESQSHTPQQEQRAQPVYPWSARHLNLLPPTRLIKDAHPSGPSPSPFPRHGYVLSATASAAGDLFLFGGLVHNSPRNDLYAFSTQHLSVTLLQTCGEVPSPRVRHAGALSSSGLLIWGGDTNFGDQEVPNKPRDDSLYLLVSREWARVMVDGPGPVGRCSHAVTMVGSKFFIFGGVIDGKFLNDIWAFDLNSLKSKPVWDSYEPAPGDEKPPSRAGHVLVTAGDRIILFGGADGGCLYNDTWLFDVSTRRWRELRCTGCIPPPRHSHAAALVDDVMYVFGGRGVNRCNLGDLAAFNLSTQQWFEPISSSNIGPSPSRRWGHAMASEGTLVFVLGGVSSAIPQGDETALIHVLDTKHVKCPNLDSHAVKPSENTAQLAPMSSASPLTQEQPQHFWQHPTFSSDAHATQCASPFQKASPEELGLPASSQITHERYPSPDGPRSQLTGVNGTPRRVPGEDDDSEGSTEYRTKIAVPDASSEGEVARLVLDRLVGLERQLSATLAMQTERDQRLAQLTDELSLKSALLEHAEVNAAEVEKRAGLELREHADRLSELEQQLSATLTAQTARDQRLAQLTDELALKSALLEQAEANAAEATKRAGLELRGHANRLPAQTPLMEPKDAELVNMQAKLDELLVSRDEAQSALQKAISRAVDADERSQRACEQMGQYETELVEVRAELGASKSELEVVRSRLTDAENGWAQSKIEADTLRTLTTASLVSTDEDRITSRLLERVRAMEAEMASRRWNEKTFEELECRNEG